MGVPLGTEMLNQELLQYLGGIFSWACLGARTIESPTLRYDCSGLSVPVGYKNGRHNGIEDAINAIITAAGRNAFYGNDPETGRSCITKTRGNPYGHIILRGHEGGTTFGMDTIRLCISLFRKHGLDPKILVDCSHANAVMNGVKNYLRQILVWQDTINAIVYGCHPLIGMMLESSIFEGKQPNTGDLSTMKYGVSIMDPCLSWEQTKALIISGAKHLKNGTFYRFQE